MTKLNLGDSFNNLLEIGSLPGSLRYLSFGLGHGASFNQPIMPGVLPQTLTYLDLDVVSINHYHSEYYQTPFNILN